MELVEGGELFDHIVQMGAFTEPVARYVRATQQIGMVNHQDDESELVQAMNKYRMADSDFYMLETFFWIEMVYKQDASCTWCSYSVHRIVIICLETCRIYHGLEDSDINRQNAEKRLLFVLFDPGCVDSARSLSRSLTG